jgi:hypothetical protein
MVRYDCAYLLGMFQEAATPEKTLDVLLEFLKDPEIKIYDGVTGGPARLKEGENPNAKDTQEVGKDDGRIMAVDALARVGAERLARRPDIVAQLRALHSDPRTLGTLKLGLDKFVPQLE